MARVALHDILCEILGSPYCYFEPPTSIQIEHPCIVYHYTNDDTDFADNVNYRESKRYTITVIDEDPDSEIPARLKKLPYCTSDRNFAVDGLRHFVYTLFYNGPRIKKEE